MILNPLRVLRQRFSAWLAAGVGGLLALGVTTTQAVIDALPPDELPRVQPGTPIQAGRWGATVHGALVTTKPRPTAYPLPDGGRAVVVDLELANLTSGSSNVYARLVALDPLPEGVKPDPTFILLRDSEILSYLHPGLPERVRIAWRLAPGATPPATLRLVFSGETYKPRDNLLGAPGWFNNRALAVMTVPVRDEASKPEAQR